jgi:uncharacterized protein YgbK (DUF1537 family)
MSAALAPDASTVVVVDDDPTGMQPVSGVFALFDADDALIAETVRARPAAVYVLTNSRSLPEGEAVAVNRRIGRVLGRCAGDGVSLTLVSRSDSTLRGHFPAESDALADGWQQTGGPPLRATLLCPAFPAAGRLTIGGLLVVRDGDEIVPVASTEAAGDADFAYATSDLRAWVAQRAPGRETVLIDLDALAEGAEHVAQLLRDAPRDCVVVLDAAGDGDLAVIAAAVRIAERGGDRFLLRTGPSLVRPLAGLPPARLLGPEALGDPGALPGLVVIGSHTARTTEQVAHAGALFEGRIVELDAAAMLGPEAADAVDLATAQVVRQLGRGTTALITSRDRLDASARRVSAAVTEIAKRVVDQVRLGYVLAKGGITSHEVAAKALGIRRALVLGTLLPGQVSVLQADLTAAGTACPPFAIFPGNVGDRTALSTALDRLEGRACR